MALTLPNNVTGEYFTRGNSNKLLVKRCRYELRKIFSSNRIVNMWNILPDYVVMSDILLILSKTDLMHMGNTETFYFIIVQPTPEPEIRIIFRIETCVKINECLLKMWT